MSSSAPPGTSADSRRDGLRWSLLIFAVALGVRGLELWQLEAQPFFDFRMGDGRVYHLWAQELAGGDWLGSRVFYQAPLYPYFLGVIYRVAGEQQLIVRLLQAVLGATGCVLLAYTGWRLFSKRIGITAGFILALYAPAMFADVTIQKSVLDVFFVCALLALLGDVDRRARSTSVLLLGVVTGLLVLTRENALIVVPVLLPWLLFLPGHPLRSRRALAGLFGLGVAVVLTPVAIRNWTVSGDFHLTTSQFGHNFYIGNNPAADGTYKPLLFARGEPLIERTDAERVVAETLGRTPTPSEVSDFYTDLAVDYIRAEPLGWITLMGRKGMLALNRVELVDTQDQYTHAEYSSVLRWTGAVFHFGVLAPLAFFGAWVVWPARRRLWPLYAIVVVYGATLLLFYIFGRYRLPLVPILALFGAAGLVGARRFVVERPRGDVIACLLATALIAGLAHWPLVDAKSMRSVTHYNIGNEFAEIGREDVARSHFETAIELDPDNALAHHNLGVVLARAQQLGVARRHFDEAIRIIPGYAEAHFNRARSLAESDETAEAIAGYRRGLASDPVHAEIHVELGRLLVKSGDREAARRAFLAALAIDPADPQAVAALAALEP